MGLKLAAPNSDRTMIGEGWVSHSRPLQAGRSSRLVRNAFRYPIFNLLIPVHHPHAIEALAGRGMVTLSPGDYLEGRSGRLDENVRDFLLRHLDYSCDEIWLQTLPRLFGYAFNPVSFWFCHKQGQLDAVLCEVNNTFGDRHFYFIRNIGSTGGARASAPKVFHVSPFFRIAGHYTFEFALTPESSDVKIRLFEGDQLMLDTRIRLAMRPFNEVSKVQIFKKYGWMTVMVVVRIHVQALKLWLKGAKFFSRPAPPREKVTYDHAEAQQSDAFQGS